MRDPKSFQIRFPRLSRIRFTAICFSVAVRCVAHRDSHIYIVTNRMKVDSLSTLYIECNLAYVYKCTHYIRMDFQCVLCVCVLLLLLKVLCSRFAFSLTHSLARSHAARLLRTLANISNCISYIYVCIVVCMVAFLCAFRDTIHRFVAFTMAFGLALRASKAASQPVSQSRARKRWVTLTFRYVCTRYHILTVKMHVYDSRCAVYWAHNGLCSETVLCCLLFCQKERRRVINTRFWSSTTFSVCAKK